MRYPSASEEYAFAILSGLLGGLALGCVYAVGKFIIIDIIGGFL